MRDGANVLGGHSAHSAGGQNEVRPATVTEDSPAVNHPDAGLGRILPVRDHEDRRVIEEEQGAFILGCDPLLRSMDDRIVEIAGGRANGRQVDRPGDLIPSGRGDMLQRPLSLGKLFDEIEAEAGPQRIDPGPRVARVRCPDLFKSVLDVHTGGLGHILVALRKLLGRDAAEQLPLLRIVEFRISKRCRGEICREGLDFPITQREVARQNLPVAIPPRADSLRGRVLIRKVAAATHCSVKIRPA